VGRAQPLDPVSHGGEGEGSWSAHLLEHPPLDLRKDVGEEDELAVREGRGDRGLPVAEHAEVGVDGLGGRQVMVVLAEPPKGPALRMLDTGEVDPLRPEALEIARAEVVADNTHEADRRIETGGERE